MEITQLVHSVSKTPPRSKMEANVPGNHYYTHVQHSSPPTKVPIKVKHITIHSWEEKKRIHCNDISFILFIMSITVNLEYSKKLIWSVNL